MSDIVRTRGDTYRIRRTVKVSGVAVNITGWTFKLTVNAEVNPADDTNQIAQIDGTLFDAVNGIVDFVPLSTDVETAGHYYFDIEATDTDSQISTLDKGSFILLQDITK